MFQFTIEKGHPERNDAGTLTGWTVDSVDRYTVTIWPEVNNRIIGIEREKNTGENDPPRRWPDFEKKALRVEPDDEFTYKLMKTKIRAMNGAQGLYKFISDNCKKDDLFYCHVQKIVEYAMDEMREAKTA